MPVECRLTVNIICMHDHDIIMGYDGIEPYHTIPLHAH